MPIEMPDDATVQSLLRLLREMMGELDPPSGGTSDEFYRQVAQRITELLNAPDQATFDRLRQSLIDWFRQYYPTLLPLLTRILDRINAARTTVSIWGRSRLARLLTREWVRPPRW